MGGGGTPRSSHHSRGTGGFLTVTVIATQAAGWLIGRRYAGECTGPLVQLTGASATVGYLRLGDLGTVVPLAALVWLASLLVPAWLLVTTGMSDDNRALRRTLAVTTAVTAAFAAPIVVVANRQARASSTWWWTAGPRAASSRAHVLFALDTAAVVGTLLIVGIVVVRSYRGQDRAVRRLLRPVVIPGVAWAAFTIVAQLARLPGPRWAFGTGRAMTAPAVLLLQIVPILAVTALVGGVAWVDLAVPRLLRTSSGLTLDADNHPETIDRYLSETLGDPSARVVFRSAGDDEWIDGSGRPARLGEDPDRAVTVLMRGDAILGAIEHDASHTASPETIELLAAGVALALDNHRLVAMASASVEGARRLAAQLVTAGEIARSELLCALTAGPLSEIDRALGDVRRGSDLETIAGRLRDAAAQVRRLSHGLFPAELIDGGLQVALTEVATVPRHRYSLAVEVTAFLAATHDPGAVLEDDGNQLRIRLSRPLHDDVVAARVAVLGGSIDGARISLPVEGS